MENLIKKWNQTNPDYPIESLSEINDWLGSASWNEEVDILKLADWTPEEISQLGQAIGQPDAEAPIMGYIEIPHQRPAIWVHPDYAVEHPPLAENDDQYYLNDHDAYNVITIRGINDLARLARYRGHQMAAVQVLAKNKISELI